MDIENEKQCFPNWQPVSGEGYIAIKKSVYDTLKNSRTITQDQAEREKLLDKREADLVKKEMQMRYELHRRIVEFAKQFIIQ